MDPILGLFIFYKIGVTSLTKLQCMVIIDVTLELTNSSGHIIFYLKGEKTIWQKKRNKL